MNRNKKLIKAGTAGLAAVTAIGLGIGGIALSQKDINPVSAAGKTAVQSEIEAKTGNIAGNESADTSMFKEEAVYVNADPAGKVTGITVADWLKNAGEQAAAADRSDLTDIVNVKGEESFTKKDGNALIWETDGNDIYYQGKTDRELPVSVSITYRLDGRDITAEELAGKSGNLEMHIQYANYSRETVKTDGSSNEIYTPFTMVTGVFLPVEHFKNVSVDHGTLLSDGSRNIAVGIALPGLKDSLSLSGDMDIDIPEDITIRAAVTDFEMDSTITLATAELFSRLGLENSADIEELEDKLNQLTGASGELAGGSLELFDGVKELKDKYGDFDDGIGTLADGIKTLANGAGDLDKGIGEYTAGADNLADGVSRYVSGACSLANGITGYTEGAGNLADGINTLSSSAGELPSKLKELSDGYAAAAKGLSALAGTGGITALADGAASLAEGIGSLNTGSVQLEKGIGSVNEQLAVLEESYDNNDKLIKQLKSVAAASDDPVMKASLEQLIETQEKVTAGQKEGIAALRQATGPKGALGAGAAALADNTSDSSTLKQGANALKKGIGQLAEGSRQLTDAVPALVKGSEQLSSAAEALPDALKQLKEGALKLTANSGTLNQGAKAILSSGKTLKEGALELKKNSGSLEKGSKDLKTGTASLLEGTKELESGSRRLEDGISDLYDGAKKLMDGMKEFDETGVQKITDTLDEKLEELLDRLNAICDSSRNYKTFSGLADDMDGSVKFIIETEAIKSNE